MDLEGRARVHAALGDPVRLAIVDRLAVTDLSPTEVGAAFGLPSNLVAHHLGVLSDAGVVERARSESDRRRTYVRLTEGHEWAAGRPGPTEIRRPRRLLFVCTRNSARSQLAAALWRRHSDLPATSAGTEPAERMHPTAVRVGRRHGLDLTDAATRSFEAEHRATDVVVAVCDHAHETLGAGDRWHWSVPDPVPTRGTAAFETSLLDLSHRVARLAAIVA